MARKTPQKTSSKAARRTTTSTKKQPAQTKSRANKKTASPSSESVLTRLKRAAGNVVQNTTKNPSPVKRAQKDKSAAASQPTPPPIISGLSLDRKLDLIGVVLTLIGLLTLLFLISPNRSTLSGQWVAMLLITAGWGGYLLPLGLIGIGLWLILRNFDQIPQLDLEKIIGIVILFLNLLTTLHFFTFQPDSASSFELAARGAGGGYIGAGLSEALLAGLGVLGTAVALAAWALIGSMLALDVSAADLFRWLKPVFANLQTQFKNLFQRLAAKQREPAPAEMPVVMPPTIPEADLTANPSETADLPHTVLTDHAVIHWQLPGLEDMLEKGAEISYNDDVDRDRANVIEETLASFGAPAHVVEVNRGPTITQFGVEPGFIESRSGRTRVRVSKIASLADDLALVLAAQRVRIQAPVPGKGYIGIEVPNGDAGIVSLRDVLENQAFTRLKSPLRLALGQDVAGNAVAANLISMPHLLIAGATGSGKSVCVNAIIATLLLSNTPDTLRLIMVDPKRVELTGYNGIPHLLSPVVVEMERVVGALQWVTREMDARYQKFSDTKTRNITDYNRKMEEEGQPKIPYLVVIIDELADLMMLAPDQTEKAITRLSQLARATGIHLIIATQRPSVDVVTGLIKANLPARIAFAVSSGVDSRVILDQPGAERLLGSGDMLFQAPDAPAPVRLQGVWVSDQEILRIVQYWRSAYVSAQQPYREQLHSDAPPDAIPAGIPLKQIPIWEEVESAEEADPMFNEAVDLIRRQGRASISMLQRRLRIGYTRAARLVEEMEAQGIVGPPEGPTHNREVLDYGPAAPPVND